MTKRFVSIIFFAVIVFCLSFIQGILAKQSKMMRETYELTVQPKDKLKNSTLDTIKQIEGILEVSYYKNVLLTLTVNGYSIDLEVHGLDADYNIDDDDTVGSGLILNQAAIDAIKNKFEKNKKSFTDYYTPKYHLGSDELLFSLDAVIANKTENETEIAYLNISQLSQLMTKLGKASETDQLRIKLADYSYLTDVKEELKDLDITITSDTNTIKEETDAYYIHILYLSMILIVSLLAVIGLQREMDGGALLAGYFVGIAAVVCLPYLFSPAKRGSTVFGLSPSGWFYFVLFAVIAMIITWKECCIRFTR